MKKYILLICMIISFGSCDEDTFTLDLLDNPNALTPASANIDLVLNGVIFNAASAEASISGIAHSLVRYTNQFGAYTGQFSSAGEPSSIGPWATSYAGITNADLVIRLADEQGLPHQKGVAQTAKAMMLLALVDAFGDVVASQAANAEFDSPALDDGAEVYATAISLLTDAVANLSQSQPLPLQDQLVGSAAGWIKVANSIKIRAYVTSRLAGSNVADLNAIVASGNYISSNADDFQIEYSTAASPTDSRSGLFRANYLAEASGYMGNYLMDKLKNRFTFEDPRLNYYIYRQTLADPMGTDDTCSGLGFDFCYLGDGYWGRDHGDNTGIPADGLARAIVGIYPSGGAYDGGEGVPGSSAQTLSGAGIEPILLASQVDFFLAEAALTMGGSGDALTYLKSGIQKSMDKVFSFAPGNNSQADIDQYIATVEGLFTNSADDAGKLDVVITELYLASFMSSLTTWNAYRRTGLPSDMQSPVFDIGSFPRSLFLPTQETEANTSIDQKLVTDQVFWDTNPAGFID